jgi:hypothetical protein
MTISAVALAELVVGWERNGVRVKAHRRHADPGQRRHILHCGGSAGAHPRDHPWREVWTCIDDGLILSSIEETFPRHAVRSDCRRVRQLGGEFVMPKNTTTGRFGHGSP